MLLLSSWIVSMSVLLNVKVTVQFETEGNGQNEIISYMV